VEVGYFHRWLKSFFVDDNLATSPSDFTPFSIAAPTDARLPGGGGYTISGLYDGSPTKVGQVNNLFEAADKFGEWYQHYNGFLLNVTARPRSSLTLQGGLQTGATVRDNCAIRAVNPEFSFATLANASGPATTLVSPTTPYCHTDTGFVTRVTGLATYVVPKVDVAVSGTFRSDQGAPLAANYSVTSAIANQGPQPLGRNLAGVPFVTVNLIPPGSLYGDRVNEVDLRIAKILKFGRTRTNVGLDFYNVLNSNPALTYNAAYSLALPFPRPTGVLQARFLKFSAQFDF
jgi:hypothetical protein